MDEKLLEHHQHYLDISKTESERGKAIIAVSHLEPLLEKLLFSAIDLPEQYKRRFICMGSTQALVNTFSGVCLTCRAFGLMDDDRYKVTEQIRKIRNYLAHNLDASFSDQSVIDHCRNLKKIVCRLGYEIPDDDPLIIFEFSVSMISGYITGFTHGIHTKKP